MSERSLIIRQTFATSVIRISGRTTSTRLSIRTSLMLLSAFLQQLFKIISGHRAGDDQHTFTQFKLKAISPTAEMRMALETSRTR